MQWSEYSRMAGGLYTPEIKQTATNRSKLVVAEGLSEKNLLKMPGKLSAPVRSMENDLRRFVTGKPILNEVVAAVPAMVAAAEAAAPAAAASSSGLGNLSALSLASDIASSVSSAKSDSENQTSHPNEQSATDEN